MEKQLQDLVNALKKRETEQKLTDSTNSGLLKAIEKNTASLLDNASATKRELEKQNAEAFRSEQNADKDRQTQEAILAALNKIAVEKEKPEEKKKGGWLGALLGLFGGLGGILTTMKTLTGILKGPGSLLGKIVTSLSTLFPRFAKVFEAVGKIFSKVGGLTKFLGPLMKILGKAFVVFQVFMAGFEGFTAFFNTQGSFFEKLKAGLAAALGSLTSFIPDLINAGLKMFGISWKTDFLSGGWWKKQIEFIINQALGFFDVISAPFKAVMNLFNGEGSIMERVESSGKMLMDAFTKFFELINPMNMFKSLFGGTGRTGGGSTGGVQTVGSTPADIGGAIAPATATSGPGESAPASSAQNLPSPGLGPGESVASHSVSSGGGVADASGGGGGGAGAGGDPYKNPGIKAGKGTKLHMLNPKVLSKFQGMAQEFFEKTGKKVYVTDGFRTRADQEKVYKEKPGLAAKPGTSKHEGGYAIDMNTPDAHELDKLGLFSKYGFHRPMWPAGKSKKTEAWHVEMVGAPKTSVALAAGAGSQSVASTPQDLGGSAETTKAAPGSSQSVASSATGGGAAGTSAAPAASPGAAGAVMAAATAPGTGGAAPVAAPSTSNVVVANNTTNVQKSSINSTNRDSYMFGASAEFQPAV